jgi:Domain of unknown function (DUF397)
MATHHEVASGWRKSSRSNNECVEVRIEADTVCVRDTTNRAMVLTLTHAEWQAFLAGVRLGEFDLPGVESA